MKILNLIKKYGTLIGFFGIIIFFTINLPSTFLTAKNFINISQQISMLAVVAFTMTVVMVMNDFDFECWINGKFGRYSCCCPILDGLSDLDWNIGSFICRNNWRFV